MNNGTIFTHDGQRYETLQNGITHLKKPVDACIRCKGKGKGTSKCITIEEALQENLIREAQGSKNEDLFTNARKASPSQEKVKPVVEESRFSEYAKCTNKRAVDDNVYYMVVDQLRAQVFLAHGLIYPAIFDKAGLASDFSDSQGFYPNEVTFCETPQPLKKGELLLKVQLQTDEVNGAKRIAGKLRLAVPLPISRLVGIEIPVGAGDLNRFMDGWVKPDVPVPRHLFKIAAVQAAESQREIRDVNNQQTKSDSKIADSIARFDRYMGVFAFLRNADRYFSEKLGYYADYPEVYFSLCASISRQSDMAPPTCPTPIPLLLALLDHDTQLTPAAKAVFTLTTSQDSYIDKEKARSLAGDIYKNAIANNTLVLAFKTLFSGDYRSAIQTLQMHDIPVEAAILAALYKYSNRQAGDHRTVKQRLHEDWSNLTCVYPTLATLGAFYGYTAMDACETSLYSVHPLIRPLIDDKPEIKFHLATAFERQLIEALYQRAFYSKDFDLGALAQYSTATQPKTISVARPARILVKDATYNIRDLLVRRYEVTLLGKLLQRLGTWKREIIDEQSEVGRCLMSQCFFIADDYELSKKSGRQILRYRIAKNKIIDLITEGKIVINPRILEVAIEEDARENSK